MRPATTVAALSEAGVRPSVRLRPMHPAQKRRALELWLPENTNRLECGPMPNLMVALPNIGGALCSTPQTLAVWLTPTTRCRAVTLPRRKTR